MKPNFNPTTPPSRDFPSEAAMRQTCNTLATARAKLLEASLYAAILRHLGYMPEPEQFKQHAHCTILHDGTHCYSWDGVEFYRNKITMQFI